MADSIEQVVSDGKILGIILRSNYDKPGVTFLTPNDYSQQLAYMHHSVGKIIEPHLHNLSGRVIQDTQEVLLIKEGKLKVNFYFENKKFFCSKLLNAGDVILLVSGGHGFEVIEDLKMVEIKQGPYMGEKDKTRFTPVQ